MQAALMPRLMLRRAMLHMMSWGGVGLIAPALFPTRSQATPDAEPPVDEAGIIAKYVGGPAQDSPRVKVQIPAVFSNGYTVPLTLVVDSPMTEADHVRVIHVLAPQNPIIPVASFQFTPQSGQAKLSTRIRLAMSQNVLAVAEMNDGKLLMNRTHVKVDIDGCK